MRRIISLLALLGLTGVLATGCDWTFGGGVEGWNERWNWVNFSGVYRALDGGVLVTDFTAASPGSTNAVTNEAQGMTDGTSSSFAGVLANTPIVPGSVTITITGVQSWQDDGSGNLSAGPGFTGGVDYGTGAWSISMPFAPPPGRAIRGSYVFTSPPVVPPGGPGSTAVSVHSFTVHQEGQLLRITDNNGAVYEGNMGSIRGSGGGRDAESVTVGESIVGQFTARGMSASGLTVEIAGTLQGTIVSVEAGRFALNSRRMFGTWIEVGGRTGDINAQASPVSVNPPTSL